MSYNGITCSTKILTLAIAQILFFSVGILFFILPCFQMSTLYLEGGGALFSLRVQMCTSSSAFIKKIKHFVCYYINMYI